jgi:NADH-quinone oxidoreductase subunit L
MRKMGGLFKYMKVTAITCWIGALALIGTPFFSGFYSKDAIIEAVGEAHRAGATLAYWCVLLGVFVTALYTFRLLFMTFHGPERFRARGAHDDHADHAGGDPHESPWVVTVPLVALAIPSIVIGIPTASRVLFGDFFKGAIFVQKSHDVVGELAHEFAGPWMFGLQAFTHAPLYLAAAGVFTAYLFYIRNPHWPDIAMNKARGLYNLLVNKYYFDWFNENVLAPLARGLGMGLWKGGDEGLIDGVVVNGSARSIGWFAGVVRQVQSGYLYHYAFAMIIGLCALVGWLLLRS